MANDFPLRLQPVLPTLLAMGRLGLQGTHQREECP